MRKFFREAEINVMLPFGIMVVAVLFLMKPISAGGHFLIAVVLFYLAQPIILTRAWAKPAGQRLNNFVCNEILYAVFVAGVWGICGMANR